ncbi:MAG: hypothetical protein FJ020_07770 [Chloroflexi bacterium]|nr:hypothetical protein [Chloroflexota bacterium]
MPCCGITIEYIYARLKAAEAPGSGSADRLLDELLSEGDSWLATDAERNEPKTRTPAAASAGAERA